MHKQKMFNLLTKLIVNKTFISDLTKKVHYY